MKSYEDKVSATIEHLEMDIYSHKCVRPWWGKQHCDCHSWGMREACRGNDLVS